jgi:hypothetical protein
LIGRKPECLIEGSHLPDLAPFRTTAHPASPPNHTEKALHLSLGKAFAVKGFTAVKYPDRSSELF